jgi:hypothetical protein
MADRQALSTLHLWNPCRDGVCAPAGRNGRHQCRLCQRVRHKERIAPLVLGGSLILGECESHVARRVPSPRFWVLLEARDGLVEGVPRLS